MRTITTCPGIGDSIWLIQKLINQPEKFHWKVGNGLPQRAKQLFDLFPQLTESFEYIPDVMYKTVKRSGYKGNWAKAPQKMYLEANSHLEAGKRIEKFLPDLPTTFKLEYKTSLKDTIESEFTVPMLLDSTGRSMISPKYIGIYTSAYSTARQWNGWGSNEWLEFINLIKPLGYKFVIIGAEWDIGIPGEIMNELSADDYINTIGQPLPVVIEILKRLDCFIGFPSGLSIINETIGAKKTLMWYPAHLSKMINSWPDPERIENKSYKGCLFCPPEQIFSWMKDNWPDLF